MLKGIKEIREAVKIKNETKIYNLNTEIAKVDNLMAKYALSKLDGKDPIDPKTNIPYLAHAIAGLYQLMIMDIKN